MGQNRPPGPRRRFDELDALRGLAALVVLAGHAMRSSPVWGSSDLLRTLDRTPLHVFVAGREAVILFFVLSGFVLSLPFWSGARMSYTAYALKRVFRIYLPYLVAMAVALGLFVLLGRGEVPGMPDFFNKHWSRPLTAAAVKDHLIFIAPFDAGEYGMVYWSLIHELRISLIFPFLMLGLVWLRTPGSILLAFLFSVAGTALSFRGGARIGDGSSHWAVSVHLIGLFILGALIAKHRASLVRTFGRMSSVARALTVAGGATLFLYARRITDVFGEHAINQSLEHWAMAVGACSLIVAVMAAGEQRPALASRPLKFLGRSSYGLYLYHAAILWALVYAFHTRLPLALIYALVVPASLIAAHLSFTMIEQPAMARGKALAERIEARRLDARRKIPVHEQLFVAGVWNRAGYASASRPTTPW